MSCPSYFIPQFSTVQVGQLIMYWGLELNVETTRHGSRSCFCKITLETTRAEATHAEATHEEVTHHSIVRTLLACKAVRNWKSQGGNISVDHLALHYSIYVILTQLGRGLNGQPTGMAVP